MRLALRTDAGGRWLSFCASNRTPAVATVMNWTAALNGPGAGAMQARVLASRHMRAPLLMN